MGDSIEEKSNIWRTISLPERVDGCAAHSLGVARCGCRLCSKVIRFAHAFRAGYDRQLRQIEAEVEERFTR